MFNEDYFENDRKLDYKPYKDIKIIRESYIPKILKYIGLSKDLKVLDIGCALGYFLKICEKYCCDTYGIDISEYAINIAKKETSAKLYVHNVENGIPMFKDNFFDLVTMFDVIEHLTSPYRVLREINRILKPGGIIIITTPNLNAIDRYIKKFIGKEQEWHGYYDKTHIYLFTPSSLKFLVERSGFNVIKVETPFHPLPNILQRMLNSSGFGGEIWLVGKKV